MEKLPGDGQPDHGMWLPAEPRPRLIRRSARWFSSTT